MGILILSLVLCGIAVYYFLKNSDEFGASISLPVSSCIILTVIIFIVAEQGNKNKLMQIRSDAEISLIQLKDVQPGDFKWRILTYENIEYYNKKIMNARKYHDDFWIGWFHNKEIINFPLFEKSEYIWLKNVIEVPIERIP